MSTIISFSSVARPSCLIISSRSRSISLLRGKLVVRALLWPHEAMLNLSGPRWRDGRSAEKPGQNGPGNNSNKQNGDCTHMCKRLQGTLQPEEVHDSCSTMVNRRPYLGGQRDGHPN